MLKKSIPNILFERFLSLRLLLSKTYPLNIEVSIDGVYLSNHMLRINMQLIMKYGMLPITRLIIETLDTFYQLNIDKNPTQMYLNSVEEEKKINNYFSLFDTSCWKDYRLNRSHNIRFVQSPI